MNQRESDTSLIPSIQERLSTLYSKLSSLPLEESIIISKGEMTPLQRMIRIILSQNTNDKLALKAFQNLEELSGGDLVNLLQLPEERIREAIAISGMKTQKARTILRVIENRDLLLRVGDMEPSEALRSLMEIPGIGPKSARVFLSFQYGMPFFPVDTHIFRVINRLGWFGKFSSPEKLSQFIESAELPAEKLKRLHVMIIRFGRDICKAKNPRCSLCPLSSECEYYRRSAELSQA